MEYYAFFSWGIVVFAAAGAVYIYRPDLFQKLVTSGPAQTISQKITPTTVTSKSKKGKKQKSPRDDNISTATTSKVTEESRSSKKRKIVAPTGDNVSVVKTDGRKVEIPRDTEDNVSDKDFAQQLAKAQTGTSIQAKSQQSSKSSARLSVKQSEERLSTGGTDADDDLSSIDAPPTAKSSSKDVSDMLEPSAAAPSTLRITSVPDDKSKTKPKSQQFEQVTSKKKRNEQARREEQKRINEESDRLHERKKQEQLRTARMAAGTSNQTKANNFTATTQNAWQKKMSSSNENTAPVESYNLLDTFEPSTKTHQSVQTQPLSNITNTSVKSANATELKARQGEDVTSAFAASARERASFSEEEQNKRIREVQQEDAWESVQSKKMKKKGRKDNSSEDSPPSTRSQSHSRASTVHTNGNSKQMASSNRFAAVSSSGTGSLEADEWEA